MAYEVARINFPINEGTGQIGQSLVYRPGGTRILKIAVSTTADKEDLPAMRLRPKNMADKKATNITAGYADDSEAFLLSWGGGHEDGPCLKASDEAGIEGCVPLKADDVSNIYLNVSHKGPDVPDSAEVTLEAYDEKTGKVEASLTVTLEKPASVPDADDLMRLEAVKDGEWRVGDGKWLPVYDPRWHPRKEVAYTELSEAPPITVKQQKEKLHVYWGGRTDPLITVADQTRPSLLTSDPGKYAPGGYDFELLNWSDDYIALRVWFFWLNLSIPHQLRVLRHEVPDAERFDFLIRKKNGKVALACTDLHWREMWGEVTETPVEAKVGMAFNTIIPLAGHEIPDKLVKGSKLHYDILLGFVERLAEDVARQDDLAEKKKVLAPGPQAHVPVLTNTTQTPQLSSRDVRTE